MDISVVIVSYKGYDRLKKCLDSLKTISGAHFTFEVIVVNNCPGDKKIEEIRQSFSEFRFIDNKVNGGYSNGCNLGVSYAAGTFILILNPDTVVTEEALNRILNIARLNNSFTLLSCRQVNEKGKESIAWGPFPSFSNLTGIMRFLFNTGYKNQIRHKQCISENIFFPDWVSGSFMIIRKNDLMRLNGFDEDFWMYSEDVDLCKRIRDNGGEIAYITDVAIEHNHGGSSRINKVTSSLTKTEVYISRHLYFSKHKSGPEKIMIQSFMVINNLLTTAITALAGLLFFFIPKLNLRLHVFKNLAVYYINAASEKKWISSRSVNSRRFKK